MLTALLDFVHRLRDAAIPVSMVETLDAVESLRHVDPANRKEFKATLAATLVKRAEHLSAFEALFDVYFAPRRDDSPSPVGASADDTALPASVVSATNAPASASGELLEALFDALRRHDEAALRSLAAQAVRQFGGIDAQRAGSRYYLYRILRQLDLSALLQR